MVSRATEATPEPNPFTRIHGQQFVEAQGSTAELGSFVNVPNQQTVEDEEPTQELGSDTHVIDRQALRAQATTPELTSPTHAPGSQATEDQESTQAFTVPPHGPQVQNAIPGSSTSASTDIPDRQAIGYDETTQEFTVSTVILAPDGRPIGRLEEPQGVTDSDSTDGADRQAFEADVTTQELTASTIVHAQPIRDGETIPELTDIRHLSDIRGIKDEEVTQEHTASTTRHITDRRAIGHEETTQGLTAPKRKTDVSGATLESTASSSTHASGGQTVVAQDTGQEVLISTSFAARLPDRQVVEADEHTLVPPFTITTLASTALTHVTGRQATEARQEDNQPRHAGSGSHAASIQEAAVASSSPEVRAGSRDTGMPKKDDERQSEISEEINNVSTAVSNARLTIAYNRRFIADDEDLSKDVIRHPRTASGWDLISVVQDTNRADFMINLSYYSRPVKEALGRFIPFSLSLQLVFQPASDNCVLFNHGGARFHLEHLDAAPTCTREPIDSMQCHVLLPGNWRILMRGEKPHEDEYHSLVQWLIWPRKFGAAIDGESTKRRKLSETRLVRKYQETTILIKDLADGQSARIWGASGDAADSCYELQRIRHIASTPSARVFACRHSKVAGILAVKVIDYDIKSVNRLNKRAAAHLTALVAAWKREMSTLQILSNHNIVSLKAFDGRFLALFLEQLPPSLDRGASIKLDSSVVRTVVHNISSALDYLEKQGIVHHDIKPHNIAHSPARGAVLLDFGQAAPATTSQGYGGTLAFLPPEFPRRGARGHAGDVWALGLTTLYILGKIPMPHLGLNVRIRDLYRYGSPPQFDEMMGFIALQRKRLDLDDEVEKLVYRMLDPDVKARVTARTIVSALDKTLMTA